MKKEICKECGKEIIDDVWNDEMIDKCDCGIFSSRNQSSHNFPLRPNLKEKRKKENWELEWEKFVGEVMCPARCGRLRFKVKTLIQNILDKQKEEMRQIIKQCVPHGHQKRFLDKLKRIK